MPRVEQAPPSPEVTAHVRVAERVGALHTGRMARGVTLLASGKPVAISSAAEGVLSRARAEADAAEAPFVESAHIALALFHGDSVIAKLLHSLIDEQALRAVLRERGVNVA